VSVFVADSNLPGGGWGGGGGGVVETFTICAACGIDSAPSFSLIFTLLVGGLEIVQVSQALENDVFESKTFVY